MNRAGERFGQFEPQHAGPAVIVAIAMPGATARPAGISAASTRPVAGATTAPCPATALTARLLRLRRSDLRLRRIGSAARLIEPRLGVDAVVVEEFHPRQLSLACAACACAAAACAP